MSACTQSPWVQMPHSTIPSQKDISQYWDGHLTSELVKHIFLNKDERPWTNVDSAPAKGERNPMEGQTTVQDQPSSKDYIDARIEASRALTDARFADLMSQMSAGFADIKAEMKVISNNSSLALYEAKGAKEAAQSAETATKNTKWNIIAAAIGVSAVIIALWSVWGSAIQMTAGILGPNHSAVQMPASDTATVPAMPSLEPIQQSAPATAPATSSAPAAGSPSE